MKYLVAFNGSESSKKTLDHAIVFAKKFDAELFAMISTHGGSSEKEKDVQEVNEAKEYAEKKLADEGVKGDASVLVRGLSPGEDIIQYSKDIKADMIFVGIEKRSRTQKIILGSTAQYVILKARCPVVTVNKKSK